jgi:hypothetical protein
MVRIRALSTAQPTAALRRVTDFLPQIYAEDSALSRVFEQGSTLLRGKRDEKEDTGKDEHGGTENTEGHRGKLKIWME